MSKKLDYSAAWSDAVALLNAHREAVIAIAGFFLFAVTWAFAFLVAEPDLQGVKTLGEILNVVTNHFTMNWMYILPVSIITAYGGFVIYVLLSGQDLPRVGDALTIALSRFLPYFVASLLLGWLTMLGLVVLLIPGLYLLARFIVLPAVMADNPRIGIAAGIKETWAATSSAGWKTFFLLFVVVAITWLVALTVNMVIGLICVLIAGPEGVPLVQTGFEALLSTAQGLILIALVTAIYRQLKPQIANK